MAFSTKTDSVPWVGVSGSDRHRDSRRGPAWSGCDDGRADDGIFDHLGHGFLRHVSRPPNGPLIVLFKEQRTDEADNPEPNEPWHQYERRDHFLIYFHDGRHPGGPCKIRHAERGYPASDGLHITSDGQADIAVQIAAVPGL